MNPLNTAISPLLNTEIYPFKQKYCNILAKSSKHGLNENIFKKILSGRLSLKTLYQ